MSRSHLPIGTRGNVRSRGESKDAKGKVVAWRAAAYFRDHDEHVREVTASAKTKTKTKHRLLTNLRDRTRITQSGELSPTDKINDLIDLWIEKFEEHVEDGRRSPTSLTLGGFRDSSNVRRALRRALSPVASTAAEASARP